MEDSEPTWGELVRVYYKRDASHLRVAGYIGIFLGFDPLSGDICIVEPNSIHVLRCFQSTWGVRAITPASPSPPPPSDEPPAG